MISTTKRGNVHYIHGNLGGVRLRGSLGTTDRKLASVVRSRLEVAVAQGPDSAIWTELSRTLPSSTYHRFAARAGVCASAHTTWDALVSSFRTDLARLSRRGKLADSTESRYLGVIDRFTAYLRTTHQTALLRPASITPAMIEAWKDQRTNEILARPNSRGGAAIVLEVTILSRLFRFAMAQGILSSNPVVSEGKPGAEPENGAEPFTSEELARLRAAADGTPDALPFLILRWTGLRGSDAVTLPWASVNLASGEITHTCQKNGATVCIPIHAELLEILRAAHQTEGPVLRIPNRKALYDRMKALGKRAGVENCRPHRFRDTLAVDLLVRGASLFDAAKILGDRTATVEAHYAPFVPALRERVRNLLGNDKGLEQSSSISRTGNV